MSPRQRRSSSETTRRGATSAPPARAVVEGQPRPTHVGERADAEAVVQEVLRTTVELLEADSASLYHWDAGAGLLRCLASWQVRGECATPDLAMGEDIVGQTLYRGRALVINDYASWEFATAEARQDDLVAGIGVPLSRGGKLLGVLLIRSYQQGTWFTDDDAHLVALLADPAAAALLTTEAYEQQRRAASRGQALLRLARTFAAESDPEKLVTDLLAEAVMLLGGDNGVVSRWDEARKGLVTLRYHGQPLPEPPLVRPGEGATGRAIQRWKALIINDYPRECEGEVGVADGSIRAAVAVPLHYDGRLLGALAVYACEVERRFTPEDAEVLELLTGIVSATIVRLERVQLDSVLLAARTVQHELNNCLARSSGYAEILCRDPALPPHLQEVALQVRESVRSAAEVLDQLQRITHLEKKDWGPSIKPTIDIRRSVG